MKPTIPLVRLAGIDPPGKVEVAITAVVVVGGRGGVQRTAEGVVIAIFEVVGFRVRVSGRANVLVGWCAPTAARRSAEAWLGAAAAGQQQRREANGNSAEEKGKRWTRVHEIEGLYIM